MRTPTVYVVHWPDFDIIKVGFSAVERWKRFQFSGANIVELYRFETSTDAYDVEAWIHEDARRMLPAGFVGIGDDSRELLGNNGSGWAECYSGTSEDARMVLAESMSRADAQASSQAHAQASEVEQWHGRTDETNARRSLSPTSATTSSVTRGRAYEFAEVNR